MNASRRLLYRSLPKDQANHNPRMLAAQRGYHRRSRFPLRTSRKSDQPKARIAGIYNIAVGEGESTKWIREVSTEDSTSAAI